MNWFFLFFVATVFSIGVNAQTVYFNSRSGFSMEYTEFRQWDSKDTAASIEQSGNTFIDCATGTMSVSSYSVSVGVMKFDSPEACRNILGYLGKVRWTRPVRFRFDNISKTVISVEFAGSQHQYR